MNAPVLPFDPNRPKATTDARAKRTETPVERRMLAAFRQLPASAQVSWIEYIERYVWCYGVGGKGGPGGSVNGAGYTIGGTFYPHDGKVGA
jgi:hypothetical protein